jgi:hypothetical protein
MSQFMGVVIACVEPTGVNPLWIKSLAEALERIARDRPDLVERYDKAISLRDAREIERIWFQCNKTLYTSLRINGITGCLHIGHSRLSVPLFPPLN